MTIEWIRDTELPEEILAQMENAASGAPACEGIHVPCGITVRLCDDETIRKINAECRGIDRSTDVLSFPTVAYPAGQTAGKNEKLLKREFDDETGCCFLGDIIISVPHLYAQAEEYGHSPLREATYLLVHGICHLMGYDHMEEDEKARMREMEETILQRSTRFIMSNGFHSGFVTITGLPNVGKSSIMNAMIGEKVAIVSSRPQTTRNRIMGVVTHENDQIVFLDTPGVHRPRTKLGEYMMQSVANAMDGMDCVLMLADVSHITDKDIQLAQDVMRYKVPKILALNKIDLVHPESVLAATARFAEMGFNDIIPVSARKKSGLDELVSCIVKYLPEGPKYFPDDMMTDQPERVIIAEIIREKALRHLREEVPHGIGVEIMGIEKISDTLTEIHATIYCEREAHKGIIIGKHGSMLQTIGTEARADIEKLLDTHANLKLWVKIRPDWRNNPADLKNLGYEK